MKVFLSSTYLDLIEHRKAVVNALRTMGEEVDHMEIFGARDEEPTKASLDELDMCDVLVGVYAYRYGTVPKDSTYSVTEQEYLHATLKKMPILVFVVNEDHDWLPKKMDKVLTKIKKFKSKASSEHTPVYFTTPDNLATQVVAAVGKLAKKIKTKRRTKPSSRRETASKELVKGVRENVHGSTLPNQATSLVAKKNYKLLRMLSRPNRVLWAR